MPPWTYENHRFIQHPLFLLNNELNIKSDYGTPLSLLINITSEGLFVSWKEERITYYRGKICEKIQFPRFSRRLQRVLSAFIGISIVIELERKAKHVGLQQCQLSSRYDEYRCRVSRTQLELFSGAIGTFQQEYRKITFHVAFYVTDITLSL